MNFSRSFGSVFREIWPTLEVVRLVPPDFTSIFRREGVETVLG